METLRNLPDEPKALAGLIEYSEGAAVSMALSRREDAAITLFAFDEGESVSSEYYLGDTLYYVLDGQMPIERGGSRTVLKTGDCVRVPAGESHAIGGAGRFKLLQITLN